MRNDKHLAEKLRRKNKSYNKISKELGIPKSTLVYWFKNEEWSQEIKKELSRKALYLSKKRLILINKARREKWERWRQTFRNQAKKEFNKLKRNPLFIAGLMLYWGEGDSKMENSLVRLSNTDSEMIRIFSKFLKKICCVPMEKIKISLVLYPDLNNRICIKFWSEKSGIPQSQFFKTQVIYGKHPTKKLSYGICNIIVSSRGLKEKIFTWLNLYKNELTK